MRTDPRVGAAFFKAHGHGNDYLVFEEGSDLTLSPDRIRGLCDRWRGVGGDGIVVVGPGSDGYAANLRMFNPDGSEFERSGNGLRVAALWLRDQGRVGRDPFRVMVSGDEIEMVVGEGSVPTVRVDMGPVTFPQGPPFVRPGVVDAMGQVPIEVGVEALPVAVGNPHAVVFGPGWGRVDLARVGPLVSGHASFPEGTNVQIVHEVGDRSLSILIWERGVGRTTASGTSACAAAAAAVCTHRIASGPVDVTMEGGSFRVTVDESFRVVLEGPVEAVCSGWVDERWRLWAGEP
ncbi:MAG: diaminopimelate epimerase [Gemmatimonadetes bacterium]|nr:diaminopimelate epimerase [Gemmatimonadota bacterium]